MLHYSNIALTMLFSQNLLLVFAFSFGTDPKTFSRPKHAFYTGLTMTGTLMVLAPVSRLLYSFLEREGLTHFSLLMYTLVATMGTYVLGLILEKLSPVLWSVMGDTITSLPTNGGILGVLLLCGQQNYTFPEAIAFAVFAGIGVLFALVSLVGIRQNSEFHHSPDCFQGMPILFMTAGLMSLAFVGFYGLHLH